MTIRQTTAYSKLLAALVFAAPMCASAQSLAGGAERGIMPPPPLSGPAHPPGGPRDAMPPYLQGLRLDETQRDKVFAILHAQAPQMRELAKTRHKAQQELASLAMSGQYSDGKARQAADALARATAEIALTMARTDSRIVALLTPEQRARMEQQRKAAETSQAPEARGCGPR